MYTKEQIREKIIEILVEDFECSRDQLRGDSDLFMELNLDSIDAVDLIVRLQGFIGKRVNPEDFKQIRLLDDVVNVIYKIVNEQK